MSAAAEWVNSIPGVRPAGQFIAADRRLLEDMANGHPMGEAAWVGAASLIGEVVTVLHQYRDDLTYPVDAESRDRRLAAIDAIVRKLQR